MSKEIEFDRFKIRVWDNDRKCYLGEIEKTVVSEDGTEFTFPAWVIPNGGIITLTGINRNPERFVKEHGLPIGDRNGAQIFEGDRLKKIKYDYFNTCDEEDMYELKNLRETGRLITEKNGVTENWIDVEYSAETDVATLERFPSFWLKNEEFGYEGESLENPEDWEIAGNIHEVE